ncbi:MAG: type I restriction-modification system subunit S [Nitrospira sp.]
MVGEWAEISLGDAIELKRGYDLPSRERRDGPFPIVSSSGISGHHAEAKAKGPGVVIGRYGTLGEVHYITEDYWPLNTALYIRDFKGNHQRFISYFLRSLDFTAYSDKAAVPGLNRNDLHTAQIVLPPLPEQYAIAHILGTLDDKIELNRRMNETLETMARALFKSWFVDFDPVRAKAEGQDLGLPKHLADLFPDSFEDSELGEIPRGWRITTLGELLELSYGKALKEEDRNDGTIPVFGSNGQVGWHNEKLAEGPGIIVGRKGNPGVVTWAPTDFFTIDTTFYVVLKTACRSIHFLYYALRTHDLASLGADSAVPGLNRNMAYLSKQVLPRPEVLTAFDSRVQSLFTRCHDLDEESRTLAALRGTLLPKLISGELRVKDVERFMEKAV